MRDYPGMLHDPTGALRYPFITPGSVYARQLWDWDSWLSDVALCQIILDKEPNADRPKMLSYGQGCVLNFLQAAEPNGSIPIRIQVKPRSAAQASIPLTTSASNIHKPVLAQHAAFLVKLDHGNAEWLRKDFTTLQAFQKNYRDHQFHAASGLYFWKDDLAIGVDNDPATFFRPPNSSASIFLNCLMFKELGAMAYLARCLKLEQGVNDLYERQADDLKTAIQKNCWDERDGFFYSADLNLRPIANEPGIYLGSRMVLHKGHPRDYACLIQRIEGWSGFLAMWCGIATPEQAKRMVEEHLKNPKTLGSTYGIRTLSKMEKMYGLYASSNPSNWNGPVWGISNYIVFRGLVKYGFTDEAKEMASKTIALFGQDYAANDALHEYYNPDNGQPIMNKGFQNWNYLVMNMIAWMETRPVVEEF
ncbi:MAG: trehalase family glycosidase [Thermoguttaceae bacterium]